MWQIMWMLSVLPNSVIHALLVLSIIGITSSYFLRVIPLVSVYAIQIRVASTVLLIFAVWLEGGISNEAKWQARVKDLEEKVKIAEQAAADANGKIETVYVDRVKVVKEIQYVVKSRIERGADKIDLTCRVDPEAISILNQAANTKGKK